MSVRQAGITPGGSYGCSRTSNRLAERKYRSCCPTILTIRIGWQRSSDIFTRPPLSSGRFRLTRRAPNPWWSQRTPPRCSCVDGEPEVSRGLLNPDDVSVIEYEREDRKSTR